MKGYESIKLQETMTTEALFNKMKDGNFSCGAPTLTGSGKMTKIDFPANNKYKVIVSISGKTISITQTYNGVSGLAKETGMQMLTKGWSNFFNKDRDKSSDDIVMVKNEIVRILGL